MGCPYKQGDYCHYTRRICSTLNWGCYDDFNQCNYMSYEKQKALEEEKKQKEAERKQQIEEKKQKDKEIRARAERELEEVHREEAENRERQRQREIELEERRQRAASAGLRIKEDRKSARIKSQAFSMAVSIVLLSLFVTHVKLFSGSLSENGVKLFFATFFLTLPLLFFPSIGTRFYGKKTLFGMQFKGSAVLRSYLATLIPSWIGLTAAWIITNNLLRLNFSIGQFLGACFVYAIACLPAWWFNHYTLPYIFDFKIYKE